MIYFFGCERASCKKIHTGGPHAARTPRVEHHWYRWSFYGYTSNFNVLFPQSICKNKWILCVYRTIINIDGSVAISSHLLFNVNLWLLPYNQRDWDTFLFRQLL